MSIWQSQVSGPWFAVEIRRVKDSTARQPEAGLVTERFMESLMRVDMRGAYELRENVYEAFEIIGANEIFEVVVRAWPVDSMSADDEIEMWEAYDNYFTEAGIRYI